MTRLRIGVIGLSHDHVWSNLAALAASNLGAVAAVAEPDPRLRARLERAHGTIAIHDSHDALLDRRDLDAVLLFTDNRASADLGVRALDRGLPVMVEKPMAADLAGADALLAAARRTGLPLMVNWPTAWRPALRHALTLVRDGAVGEPVQVNHRGGHAGPREFGCSPQFCEWLYDPRRNGAGALIDYGGYGGILCRTLLGRPAAVTAVAARLRTEGLASEDTAVVVLRYPRALALLEASWTQIGGEPAFAVVVYGDRGTVIVHQPRPTREGQKVGPGRVQLVTADRSEMIDPPALPEGERDGPSYFLSRLQHGRPVEGLCAPDVGRDVQEILAAALRSAAAGQEVALPLGPEPGPRR
jgi:predicted dehydrogenase